MQWWQTQNDISSLKPFLCFAHVPIFRNVDAGICAFNHKSLYVCTSVASIMPLQGHHMAGRTLSLYTCAYTPDFVSRSTGTSVRRRSASSPPCCSCSSAACCLWHFQRPSLNTLRAGPCWSLCTSWSSPWPPLDLGTLWQVIKDQHSWTLDHSVLFVHHACRSHFLNLLTVMTVSIFSCVQAVQK